MEKCKTCIHKVYDYCIEHNQEVKDDDKCDQYMSKTEAEFMCQFMCPECEEE